MTLPIRSSAAPRAGARVRIAALVLLAAAGLVALFLAMRGRGAGGTASTRQAAKPPAATGAALAAPVPVRVETLAPAVLDQPIRVTGTLRSDGMITLSTKATGPVKRVLVKEGDRVARGQLLVEIDASELIAQREREVAKLRAAQARVAQALASRGITDSAAATDLRRAQQALATARARLSQAKSQAGIANTEAESRVASASASLQAARERLKSLQEGSRRQEKAASEAAVSRAQAEVARAKRLWERRNALLEEGAIAQETVDDARRDYDVALADLEAARQRLSLVEEGPRAEEIRVAEEAVRQVEASLRDAQANLARRQWNSEEVAAAEAQTRQAEAARDAAKAALARRTVSAEEIREEQATVAQARAEARYYETLIAQTKLFSPVNGVVTSIKIHAGESVVQTRSELMTLAALDTLYFEATAPEAFLSYLRPGLPATVLLDALPNRQLKGTLREIIPVAEGTNRSLRLRIALPRRDAGQAVVGGFARAMIHARTRTPVLSVPRTALVPDEGEPGVFLLVGGKAKRRPVQVGDAGGVGDRVPVISGLSPGEVVIVSGAGGLTDGQAVTAARGTGG
jgi:RND family efflux transporter MFP subunit